MIDPNELMPFQKLQHPIDESGDKAAGKSAAEVGTYYERPYISTRSSAGGLVWQQFADIKRWIARLIVDYLIQLFVRKMIDVDKADYLAADRIKQYNHRKWVFLERFP